MLNHVNRNQEGHAIAARGVHPRNPSPPAEGLQSACEEGCDEATADKKNAEAASLPLQPVQELDNAGLKTCHVFPMRPLFCSYR